MQIPIKIFFYLFFLVPFTHFSQNKIGGRIKDSDNKPLPYCLLGILNAADSAVVKGSISNDVGDFNFEGIAPGKYFIKVTASGYSVAYSNTFNIDSLSELSLETIILKSEGKSLDEISITAIKNPFEFKNGNITVNVEGSPLASGNSVYDLLIRMPGVIVDGDNFSLQGKGGVRFLLNDRLQQITGPQLISLLKSIHASTIEKIELITNPPAKYDASGSGGLINIITKKIKITGFSGNFSNSFSQGFYTNNFTQLSLNYKGKKINLFSNFNGSYADFRSVNNWTRIVQNGAEQTTLEQNYVEKKENRFVSCFLGADWFVNDKATLSIRIDQRPGNELIVRENKTAISDSSLGYRNLLFNFEKPNTWLWQDYNVNYEQLFDTIGTKLTFNTVYNIYPDQYQGQFENHYLNSNLKDIQTPTQFRSENNVDIRVLASKLDFEKNITKTLRLESGLKASWQSLSSDFIFENYDGSNQTYVLDSLFTNKFLYRENIQAAYLDLKKDIKKINLNVGIRAENTVVQAESETSTFTYQRMYLNFFPNASVSYNPSERNNFQVSYNRRINRVDYNRFNPYPSFKSILTREQGNPNLIPMYTHNLQFVYGFKGKIINTVSYSKTDNFFLGYTKQDNETKELIFYTANLKRSNTLNYSIFIQQDLKRWWSTTIYSSIHYFDFSGDIDGVYYSAKGMGTYFGNNNQITLSKNTKLEVSGWVVGPWLDGVTRFKSRGGINFGVKQDFFKEKLSVSLGVYDITHSNGTNTSVNFSDQRSVSTHQWDSRRFYINLNYNFGKIKVEQKNVKSVEEKDRVKK